MALGQVSGNLSKSDEAALFIADRVDHHAGPEQRTVLANAPALALKATFADRCFECAAWQSCCAVLVGVERREVLSDDIGGRVALGPLCACIPTGHDPLGIEHEDGVVHDGIDQKLKELWVVSWALTILCCICHAFPTPGSHGR